MQCPTPVLSDGWSRARVRGQILCERMMAGGSSGPGFSSLQPCLRQEVTDLLASWGCASLAWMQLHFSGLGHFALALGQGGVCLCLER